MKISTKIIIACLALVALAATTFLVTTLVQRSRVRTQMEAVIQQQALSEASKIIETLYVNCEATDRRNRSRLTHDLDYRAGSRHPSRRGFVRRRIGFGGKP
ncbi:MAG: hypothetical protein QM813_04660 [Verrucomicrobiota bacterium]